MNMPCEHTGAALEHTEQQECKERPHTQTVLRKVYHVLEILSLERAVLESEQPVLRGLSCEDGLHVRENAGKVKKRWKMKQHDPANTGPTPGTDPGVCKEAAKQL